MTIFSTVPWQYIRFSDVSTGGNQSKNMLGLNNKCLSVIIVMAAFFIQSNLSMNIYHEMPEQQWQDEQKIEEADKAEEMITQLKLFVTYKVYEKALKVHMFFLI